MIHLGLDMYLQRHHYVPNFIDGQSNVRQNNLYAIQGVKVDASKVSKVIEEVAYWRKANAIHNWFVQNIQGGEDESRPHFVSLTDLQTLLSTINEVLEKIKLEPGKVCNGKSYKKDLETGLGEWEDILEDGEIITNPEICEELLPSHPGFFFGSTDYDQYYVDQLKRTKSILEDLFNNENENEFGDYYYYASW